MVLVIAVGVGGAYLVDSVAAIRVESRLSADIEASAGLPTSPDVYIAGTPYLAATATGEITRITVNSLDVPVDGLGIVNARTELANIKTTPEQVLSGNLLGSHAELMKRIISLDGVAFGNLLGMTDLDIANPYNIAPSGGVASEAQLTGTPDGFDEPVSVIVDLRLVGPEFRMTVTDVLDAPQGRTKDAVEAFTYTLDTRRLPLAGQASLVQVIGGSLYFEAQRYHVTVQPDVLAPVASSDGTWSDFDQ
ncbi:putative DUF2993 family protein [Corynebacterium uterequi]|uniref:Putative DUF2993 family protein n=1 Tax=Corynebacterium uterequi TaxID=1072256 RepID=A0A0G3HES5_9CORY|nr:putative DUF2993 family protein [Corynebacterium uterequi]